MSRMPLAATLWPPSKMSSTCAHDLVSVRRTLILSTVGPRPWFEWSKWCIEWHLLATSPCRKINSWKMSLPECRSVGMWGWLLLLLLCVCFSYSGLLSCIPPVHCLRIIVPWACFFFFLLRNVWYYETGRILISIKAEKPKTTGTTSKATFTLCLFLMKCDNEIESLLICSSERPHNCHLILIQMILNPGWSKEMHYLAAFRYLLSAHCTLLHISWWILCTSLFKIALWITYSVFFVFYHPFYISYLCYLSYSTSFFIFILIIYCIYCNAPPTSRQFIWIWTYLAINLTIPKN